MKQFDELIEQCAKLFEEKTRDYGTAWRILRPSSLTDQIYIKAKRIRTIQELDEQKVEENEESEFIGIINYCIMALLQLRLPADYPIKLTVDEVLTLYYEEVGQVKQLLENKNHDYGEAWRDMRVSSMTDLILMKLLRIKEIEDNDGRTMVSEGLEANYMDIFNYAIFCLILLEENKNK